MKLAEILDKFRPQIIHTALVRPTVGYALSRVFPRSAGTCWVAADHGIHEWHERGMITGFLMEILMPALLANADQIVTVSPDARRQLLRRGLNTSKLKVIPNGVDTARFYPRLRRDRSPLTDLFHPAENGEQIFLIGAAGNLRYIKGMDLLIDAAAAVIPSLPNARFVLWGNGPEMETLKNRVQLLGISHVVAFAGYEPQLENLLPMLDLYVQPSRVESFGLGAAEAMASGVPVIVADVGGLSDLVVNGVSGVRVKPNSSTELAAAIRDLHNNTHLRGRLAEAGRLRILQHYSRQGMVSATVRLYEQLLQGGPASHD